jgi:ABC-type multidrug transport system fused ATPase/permease subunit
VKWVGAISVTRIALETVVSLSNFHLLQQTLENLQDMILTKVVAAPINTYFDVTPTSRILKAFSEDLRAFDIEFMFAI